MANVGGLDRVLRLVVGAALLLLGAMPNLVGVEAASALRWVFLAVGLVMLSTAIFRFCPLYPMFGLNTCKLKNPE